ncbi:hypothetical protein ACTXT7_011492 [Hymenolepis weldensis]
MEIASLSSYPASNDSECDKSSKIKLLPNKRGSTNSSHSSCTSSSAFGLKEQLTFSEGEQLAKKVAEDQTYEQIFYRTKKLKFMIFYRNVEVLVALTKMKADQYPLLSRLMPLQRSDT